MKRDFYQNTLFDDIDNEEKQPQKKEIILNLTDEVISKFKDYKLENYISDIENEVLIILGRIFANMY